MIDWERDDLYWHFLPDTGLLTFDRSGTRATVGPLPTIDKPVLCERGWHGCKRPLDALQYAWGALMDLRALSGTVIHGDDKTVASECEILCIVDATHTLHEFGIWCAEQALALAGNSDPHGLEVLRVKRWLDGAAADEELVAARAAARAAAWAAAWDAAWAAAWDAAWVAARDAQNTRLEAMLRTLVEKQS